MKMEKDSNMIKENMIDSDLKKEQSYQSTIELMNCTKCMTTTHAKVDMYLNIAKKFSKLTNYKESKEYSKLCKQSAAQIKEEIKKTIYEGANNKKNHAKSAADYKTAADEFRQISGFMNADDMAFECDQLSIVIRKRIIRKRLLSKVGVFLCILSVIFAATNPISKYYVSNMFMLTGTYGSAAKVYESLGEYKGSKEKFLKCQYLSGLNLEEEGKFIDARKAYVAAGDYKDSEDKIVNMDKHIIKNSNAGDVVELGNCKWTVLDTDANESQVLLMKKEALSGRAYHNVFEDVTWEKSTLRKYLNVDFISQTFSENEQNNIILTNIKNNDNVRYGTEGGNETQDYIFLLSVDEVEKYSSLFKGFKSSSWLRSPGNSPESAAFLTANGFLMDYGYMVTSEEFTIRPVLWFNIN